VHKTLNTKVAQQVTLYKIAKGSEGFAFFTPLHSKSAMPIFMKVVCLAKLHIFSIG
jgi:hypothetical protein